MKEKQKYYPYQELIKKPPPKGVDISHLEVFSFFFFSDFFFVFFLFFSFLNKNKKSYLSEEEFLSVFEMKKAQFIKV